MHICLSRRGGVSLDFPAPRTRSWDRGARLSVTGSWPEANVPSEPPLFFSSLMLLPAPAMTIATRKRRKQSLPMRLIDASVDWVSCGTTALHQIDRWLRSTTGGGQRRRGFGRGRRNPSQTGGVAKVGRVNDDEPTSPSAGHSTRGIHHSRSSIQPLPRLDRRPPPSCVASSMHHPRLAAALALPGR